MKCDMNDLLWPCMAITMCDKLSMICVACEGIPIAERGEARKALLNFALDANINKFICWLQVELQIRRLSETHFCCLMLTLWQINGIFLILLFPNDLVMLILIP